MSEFESNIENALKDMGVNFVDAPPADDTPMQQSAPAAEQTTTDPAPADAGSSLDNSDAQPQAAYSEPEPSATSSDDVSDEEFETMLVGHLSERLGVQLNSLDDLSSFVSKSSSEATIDERVKVIADFVAETGRSPEDWFKYQSFNPSEMDDLSVVKTQLLTDNPDLSSEDVDILISRKYKLDEDTFDEDEVKYSKLQLKMDAKTARTELQKIRENFKLPVNNQSEPEPLFDGNWVSQMSSEVDALEGIDFDLGGEKVFTFGIDEKYKPTLKEKNANLERYFDEYVRQDGSWDFEKLSMHRAVLDNVDTIVRSAYQQGISDGQRKVVENTANIQANSPSVGSVQNAPNLRDQILKYFSNDDMMRIR